MSRTLYSPRLSDDVVRALYREARHRNLPMTRLADDLLRQAIGRVEENPPGSHVHEHVTPGHPETREVDAA